MQPGQICHVDLRPGVSDGEICQVDMGPEGFQVSCQVHVAMRCNLNSGAIQHCTVLYIQYSSCHIKNVDILGGTPTWDLDVPVHPIVSNSAHLQVYGTLEDERSLPQ